MNKIFIFIICLSLVLTGFIFSPKRISANSEYQEYVRKLIWSDEFQNDNVNTKYWNFESGVDTSYSGKTYSQLVPENVSVKDGKLDIKSQVSIDKDGKVVQDSNKTGKINTKNKFQYKQGEIEIRAKVSKACGLSSTAYMLGVNKAWPKCGEIGLFQNDNRTDFISQTVITPVFNGITDASLPPRTYNTSVMDNDYHVYKMVWGGDILAFLSVEFYIDGKLVDRYEPGSYTNNEKEALSDNYWPFNQAMYLNIAALMRPDLAGEITPSGWDLIKENENLKDYETHTYVDYIRVYQNEHNPEIKRFEKIVPKITKATKKKKSKKIKIELERPLKRDRFDGFSVRVYSSKKQVKKDKKIFYQRINKFKTNFKISKKKFKNKKNLCVRVKYYKEFGGFLYYSKYSKLKKVKIKK